jgi:Na+-driven multidrug efflux pump
LLIIPILKKSYEEKIKYTPSLKGTLSAFWEGIPLFIRTIILLLTLQSVTVFVSRFNTEALAAYQIASTIYLFMQMFIDGVEGAITPLIAEQIGAKNFDEAKIIVKNAQRVGLKLSTILFFILVISSFILPPFFTPDTSVYVYATFALLEFAATLFYSTFTFIMDGVFVASRNTVYMAVLTAISSAVCLLTFVIFIDLLPRDPIGFVLLLLCYDVVFIGCRTVFAAAKYSKDRWLNNVIKESTISSNLASANSTNKTN